MDVLPVFSLHYLQNGSVCVSLALMVKCEKEIHCKFVQTTKTTKLQVHMCKYKDEVVVSHWPLLAKSGHNNGCPCNLAPTETSRGHTETIRFEVATRLRVSTTKRSAWPHHLQC